MKTTQAEQMFTCKHLQLASANQFKRLGEDFLSTKYMKSIKHQAKF